MLSSLEKLYLAYLLIKGWCPLGDGTVTAGSYSDGVLNIPLVQVDSDYYAVQFKLTSSEPLIFTLYNAESASP